MKSQGVALVLSALPIVGVMGFDKLYVGATGLFLVQFVCTLTLVGLLFSGPYQFISTLALTLAILVDIAPFLYPEVEWTPTTTADRVIAWVVVAWYVIGLIAFSRVGGALRAATGDCASACRRRL